MATAMKTRPGIKILPFEDRVVILPLEESEAMRGGLYIPDTAKEKPTRGEVIAVGTRADREGRSGKDGRPAGRPGDLRQVQRDPVQVGGDELIIIKASDILAKIG